MALNIKDPETDRLARELSQATGESITVAARMALRERLARVQARSNAAGRRADLRAIVERGRRRAAAQEVAASGGVEYDEHGLPV